MKVKNTEAEHFPPNLLASIIIFFVAFSAYLFCAYPALVPRDGADLLKTALTLYPAHPPGYPLYALSGHLWAQFFSLGNFAYRLNIFSGFWGATACAVFYLWARKKIDGLSAAAISLSLAFSQFLWKFSLLPEMYSAQAFFAATLLYLSEGPADTQNQRATLSGLMAGLGIVNHQSLILVLPAIALIWIENGVLRQENRAALKLSFFFLLIGLCLYLYMPIELKSIPVALGAITRSQYGTLELSTALAQPLNAHLITNLILYFSKRIFLSSSPAIFLLALFGIFSVFSDPSKRKIVSALLLGIFIPGLLFMILARFDISNWIARSTLEPSFIVPTLFLCALVVVGLSSLKSKNLRRGLAVGTALWAFGAHFPQASHRYDFAAQDYIDDILRLVPPGSALLARGDTAVFGLKYSKILSPSSPPRHIYSDVDQNPSAWILRQKKTAPASILGISFSELSSLQIIPSLDALSSHALIDQIQTNHNAPAENEKNFWDMTLLRPSPQLENGDSYDHDIRRSFALAHYLASGIDEKKNPQMSEWNAKWAIILDPEDYHLSH